MWVRESFREACSNYNVGPIKRDTCALSRTNVNSLIISRNHVASSDDFIVIGDKNIASIFRVEDYFQDRMRKKV